MRTQRLMGVHRLTQDDKTVIYEEERQSEGHALVGLAPVRPYRKRNSEQRESNAGERERKLPMQMNQNRHVAHVARQQFAPHFAELRESHRVQRDRFGSRPAG